MSGLNLPKFQPPSGPPPMRFDDSHVSRHFLEGNYQAPITQKVTLPGSGSFHIDTPVDGEGNIGESKFNLRGFKLRD